jgi:hypothetical protein
MIHRNEVNYQNKASVGKKRRGITAAMVELLDMEYLAVLMPRRFRRKDPMVIGKSKGLVEPTGGSIRTFGLCIALETASMDDQSCDGLARKAGSIEPGYI